MSADAPRATAEDGSTGGNDPGRVRHPDAPDVAAEDAGDPAEFAEPGADPGDRAPSPYGRTRPEPDLPNFAGRRQGPSGGGEPNGDRSPAGPVPHDGSGGRAGFDQTATADGVPPAPTLGPGGGPVPPGRGAAPAAGPPTAAPPAAGAPTAAPGAPGGPPPPGAAPSHLRQPPGEPGQPGSGPAQLRVPRLPGLPNLSSLRRLPGLRRGESESRAGRVRGVRVHQRLWRVDPWSVFKISAVFYLCLFFILLVAGTLLWNVGRSSGTIDQFESFVTRMAAYGECTPRDGLDEGTDFETDEDCPDGQVVVGGFELDDGTVFRAALFGGVVLVVTGALGNVLMTVLLNLINEVSGGARYTIIKEPNPRPAAAGPRPPGPDDRSPPRPPEGSTNAAPRR